jgi:predicted transcriptional regulator
MTNKKMTKREMFEQIKANYQLTDAEVAFIDHELELLAKKNASEKKPTAQQVANEGLKSTIIEVLTDNGGLMTVTDVQKSCEELSALSNQRVSALLRQLKDDGKVERVEDKRKAYFKAV